MRRGETLTFFGRSLGVSFPPMGGGQSVKVAKVKTQNADLQRKLESQAREMADMRQKMDELEKQAAAAGL